MPILTWLNDEEARKTSSRVPYRLLEADDTLSYSSPLPVGEGLGVRSENMLIQGDNLEALKSLLPYYGGQVKCIYIDPPYNTRSAFEHYDDNLEYSIWLSTMYPRLEMLRDLLADDGSIWVSIDDNEGHYLKVVMDELFGRQNFVSNVIWQKKYAAKSDSKYLSESHNHILVYARNLDTLKIKQLPRTIDRMTDIRIQIRAQEDLGCLVICCEMKRVIMLFMKSLDPPAKNISHHQVQVGDLIRTNLKNL